MAGWIWGYDPKPFPTGMSGAPSGSAACVFTLPTLLNLAVALVLMLAFFALFKYSLMGIAMRAVGGEPAGGASGGRAHQPGAGDHVGAGRHSGRDGGHPDRPVTTLSINMMAEMQVKAFTAGVLGGFTSLPGAVVGGLLLGVLENLVGQFIPQLKTPFAFALIVLVLIFRPAGLLGTVQRKKV